ncbi:MAG: PP2C family protein-serine/threonine phosphatase, partial [Vicinamibacterales bacterium]
CYALFDFKRRTVTLANSGLPYPVRWARTGEDAKTGQATLIEIAGVPLGSFPGSSYDELTLSLQTGDIFVFCSDGVTEALDVLGREFGTPRLMKAINQTPGGSAREVVDAVTNSVLEFRGDAPPHDDMTVVAIRVLS